MPSNFFSESVSETINHFTTSLRQVSDKNKNGDYQEASQQLAQCEAIWPGTLRTLRDQIKLSRTQENSTKYQPQSERGERERMRRAA